MPEPVRILVTGGTIDEVSQNTDGTSVFADSFVPLMLEQARVTASVFVETLMLVDSRNMSDAEREAIHKHCVDAKESRIVITHGTFTMPETARYLGERITDKTIVLTGAAVPFTQNNSDALFNLGFALATVLQQQPGVYVAMNGRVFEGGRVGKNAGTGTFEAA